MQGQWVYLLAATFSIAMAFVLGFCFSVPLMTEVRAADTSNNISRTILSSPNITNASPSDHPFSSLFKKTAENEEELLSSLHVPIPFYMYSGKDWDIFTRCNTTRGAAKHSAEPRFTRTLESHPWRVDDPKKALIIVVPLWLGHANDGACELKLSEYVERASEVLRASPIFKAQEGLDHLLHLTGHRVPGGGLRDNVKNPDLYDVFRKFVFATNELTPAVDRKRGYCAVLAPFPEGNINVPFADTEAVLRRQSPEEYVNARPMNFVFVGQADSRQAYSDRRFAIDNLSNKFSPSYFIETPHVAGYNATKRTPCDEEKNITENCKDMFSLNGHVTDWRLGRSKWGFFFAGDTPSSQRLSVLGRLGTLPVMVSDSAWDRFLPFHCQIPWKKILYSSYVADFRRDPVGSMAQVIDEDREAFDERLEVYQKHIPDFVWEVPNSRVAENILRSAVQNCQQEENLLARGFEKRKMTCVDGHYEFAMGRL